LDIRTYQRGDETAQAAIYNEAACDLPKFKPATSQEVMRRLSAPDFDPALRFYAVEDGTVGAYVVCHANGRVSYPWCRKGWEHVGGSLFQHGMDALRQRGVKTVFAAYRADWGAVLEFFRRQSFSVAREMVNFVLDVLDMPTSPARRGGVVSPLNVADVPTLFALAPRLIRCHSPAALEQHLFKNPYFGPDSVFVMRGGPDRRPIGAGLLINNGSYADPLAVDSGMPCFRLGAFGTEGMQTKRIKGLFSVLCADDPQASGIGTELMGHAAALLQDSEDISALAAQVPSDLPHLLRFYQLKFRRQGAFPVLQRVLVD
jgi:predicted N-acetyltransferase YhbS